MNYLMVLPVQFYRVDDNTIACESAFANHLRDLAPKTREWGEKLVVLTPGMSQALYQANKDHLSHIDCEKEGIDLIVASSSEAGRLKYFLTSPFLVWPKIWKAVKNANVVHSGPSDDLFRPFEVIAILFSIFLKRKSVFVKDIDHRSSTEMLYKQQKLSKKSYFLRKFLYDKYMHLQMKLAAKYCSVLFLKGQSMVDDYGKGRECVKNFYDTAHDLSFVLDEKELDDKLKLVDTNASQLKLVYFGRLVEYKGIKDMILATKIVAERIKSIDAIESVSLTIIGAGDQKAELEDFVKEEAADDLVLFMDAIKYGKPLFAELATYDYLLAAPWREDTPRSVFDSMACGLPILAYDTYYYKDLEKTGAVKTIPWLSKEDFASLIVSEKQDKNNHKKMIEHGVKFARENTQEIWLAKRHKWQQEFLA